MSCLSKTTLFTSLLLVSWLCHAELKVGYIQLDKLLQDAPQTQESNRKLDREFNPRTQELEKISKQIHDMETAFDRDALTASDTDKRNRQRDIQTLKIELQRKQRTLREDINLRRNEELANVQERIIKAVQQVADTENFDLVLHSGGVVYFSKRVDLTDRVLKILGKK